jgi:hypothetical protein
MRDRMPNGIANEMRRMRGKWGPKGRNERSHIVDSESVLLRSTAFDIWQPKSDERVFVRSEAKHPQTAPILTCAWDSDQAVCEKRRRKKAMMTASAIRGVEA